MILLKRILEWLRKLMSNTLEKPVKENQLLAVYSTQLETAADDTAPPLGTSETQTDYVDTGLIGGTYILFAMTHFGEFTEEEPWFGMNVPYISEYGSGGDGGRISKNLSYYTEIVNGQMRIVYEVIRWSPTRAITGTHFEGTVVKLRGN